MRAWGPVLAWVGMGCTAPEGTDVGPIIFEDTVLPPEVDDDEPEPPPPAWEYEVGMSYLSETGYIEFVAGDTPVVLSASHGGYLEPDEVGVRTEGVHIRDAYTQELTHEIADAFYAASGSRPHLVINLLARNRLDANRSLEEAQEDPIAEAAWLEYHDFIGEAKAYAVTHFDRALYLDIHGHGHEVQRVELGYLLNPSDLALDDADLSADAYIDKSSIRTLYLDNEEHTTFAGLVRGPTSFGALLEDWGFPSVPSDDQLAPEPDWPYFTGGYNTRRWGSREGGPMSGIQVEANQDARFDEEVRLDFADALADVTLTYLWEHYQLDVAP